MSEPKKIKAKGDGVSIQLAVWEGKGKEILCVHGLTANCRCWDVIASSLTPKHKVIAMDLRGRGHSDSPPSGYSVENHCRDILALMDDQRPRTPCAHGPFSRSIYFPVLCGEASWPCGPVDLDRQRRKGVGGPNDQVLCRHQTIPGSSRKGFSRLRILLGPSQAGSISAAVELLF